MRLKLRVQKYLVVARKVEDSSDWAFTICRRGMEELLGERLPRGEEVTVEVIGTLLGEEDVPV